MRRIAHISDLHFGREDPEVVRALLADLRAVEPHVVAVSGDLTQRARRSQYAAARRLLDALPAPAVVVPGNHDVPLYDVARRALAPLGRWRRFVGPDLAPLLVDEELAVLGLNTARADVWKNGRFSTAQIAHLRAVMGALPASLFKVLVAHHPLVPPPDRPRETLARRGGLLLEAAAACGVDLVLAGHLHLGYTEHVEAHDATGRPVLVLHAGTAVSRRRRRGEPNAYNLVTVDPPGLTVEVRTWRPAGFAAPAATRYVRTGGAWVTGSAVAAGAEGDRFPASAAWRSRR